MHAICENITWGFRNRQILTLSKYEWRRIKRVNPDQNETYAKKTEESVLMQTIRTHNLRKKSSFVNLIESIKI